MGRIVDTAPGNAIVDTMGVGGGAPTQDVVRLKDALHFRRAYWLLCGMALMIFVAAFPFFQVTSVPYLQDRFDLAEGDADFVTSLPNLVAAITSPMVGFLVDRYGKRPAALVLSSAM